MNTPVAIFLVGLPASGKSTFVKTYLNAFPGTVVISTDDYFQKYADENNMTYQEAFKKVDFKNAEDWMLDNFYKAIRNGDRIIIDRTNLSPKSRGRFLELIPKFYECQAVVFNPPEEVRKAQSDKRYKETGKIVSSRIVDSMRNVFSIPTKSEGFVDVLFYDYDLK